MTSWKEFTLPLLENFSCARVTSYRSHSIFWYFSVISLYMSVWFSCLYRESLESQKYWLHPNLLGQAVCSAACQRPASAWAEEMRKNQVLIFWSVCSSYLLDSLITDSDLGLCRLGWEIFGQQLLEILRVISTRGRRQACSSVQVRQLSIDRHLLSHTYQLSGIDPGA